MNKNHTTLTLVISAIVMVVSIGTLIFFFRIIENKNKHTSAVLTTLANKIADKNDSQIAESKMSEINSAQNSINNYFVDLTKIDSFVNYLEGLGSKSGAVVKVDSFETSDKEKNVLSVRLSSKGSFEDIIRTILLLENSPYNIHITNISLGEEQIPQDTNTNTKTNNKSSVNKTQWQNTISFTVITLP
ncbi:MAG: hypothetical protein KGI58_00545 [Patescibacteria group bacterium]|nr:hypothetical protein [Patescibacteria group bacterium]